jgi:hypothetical protein
VEWGAIAERAAGRFEETAKPVLRGNAAYGAGLANLMAGRLDDASPWFERAASA